MLPEPSASVVSVSTAPRAIPAETATSEPTPCAVSANATAALATPTFPGVNGRIPARSSAGMISTAAARGRSIPKAAAMPVAAATRSAIESPTQPAICAAARGQRPRTRKTSRAWPNFVPGRESRARHAMTAATPAASNSRAIGQRGSTPLADAIASTTASHAARTALSDPAIPPTVQILPSLWSTREKRANRTAVPIRAGASAFTIEPVQ